MNRLHHAALIAGVAALTAGCAGDPTVDREAKVELSPMEQPAVLVGQSNWLNKGEPTVMKMASLKDGMIAGTWLEGASKGCSWVNDGWFAPAESFENCRGNSGTQKISKEGDIWPLAVGKTVSYKVTGENDKGNNWKTTRRCEVKDAVMVSIQEKPYAAYEVICKDSWSTAKWYVSPDLKRVIKYNRRHKDRGLESDRVAVLE